METNFNLGSLRTIQGPLLEYLTTSNENIKRNIEIFRDEKKMPTNHDYVKTMEKLDKTFNMIGLHSLSDVFALCGESLDKVASVSYDTDKHVEILSTVLKIVENTEVYIKLLSNGANDNPTKFFEDYQTLASLIRKKVTIKDLFNPRLELKSTIQANIRDELRRGIVINASNKKNLLENFKVVEQTFSNNLESFFDVLNNGGAFVNIVDKDAYQATCKNIYEKFNVAQKLKISKPHYIAFGLFKLYLCILSPVFNSELAQNIRDNKKDLKADLISIQEVIFDLISDIKELDDGAKTGGLKVSDTVVKNILFNLIGYIKSNPKLVEMNVFKELSMYFDLDSYADQLLDTKMNIVEQNNINISAVEKLFADLKEEFTLLDNRKKSNDANLTQQIQRIMSINNKLAETVLPVKEVHILVSQISATLSLVKNKKIALTESIERELSIALVLLEYGVSNIIKNNVESRYRVEFGQQSQIQIARIKASEEDNQQELATLPMPRLDSASQRADERKSFAKIFEQVSLDLVEMEETLDLLLRNDGEGVEQVGKFLKPLSEMKGIFSVIGKGDLTPVLSKISEVWTTVQAKGQKGWNVTPEVNESIVLISGLSLFVAAFKAENDVEAEEVYENLLKRFNTSLFKTGSNDDSSVVELIDFNNVKESTLIDSNEVAVVATIENPAKESKPLSLLDLPNIAPVKEATPLTKEQIISQFNNFSGKDVESFVSLIVNFLTVSNSAEAVVNAGKLLGDALANVSIDKNSSIIVSSLKDYVSEESLVKVLKGKSKITNETKQKVRSYMNSLPDTKDNKLSNEGAMVHSNVEKAILEMLNIVAINNMPVFEIKLSSEEKTPEIALDSIGKLQMFKEIPNDEELLEFFLEEVFEIMDALTSSIQKLDRDYDDKDSLTNIRRYFHTLKGSGRTIGLDFWGEAAWMTEQTLNKVLSGEIELTKEVMSAVKHMKSFFEVLVNKLKDEKEINVDLVSIKMLWMPINNKLTHHVEVEVPSGLTHSVPVEISVEETVEPVTNSVELSIDEPVEDTPVSEKLVLEEPTMSMEEFILEHSEESEVAENIVSTGLVNGVVTDLEEDKLENIIIHGKEVPLYLFNMYQDESIIHIGKLKEFAHANYSAEVVIDSNFMLHAHTLSSISKTVNLHKIATIASNLEDVAMLAVERELVLSSDDMNILRHAVDNLELFQDYNNEADVSFFETLISKLEALYNKLVGREDEELLENTETPMGLSDVEVESKVEAKETVEVEEAVFATHQYEVPTEQIAEEIERQVKSALNELVKNSVKFEVEQQVNKSVQNLVETSSQKIADEVAKNNQLLEEIKHLQNEKAALTQKYENELKTVHQTLENSEKQLKQVIRTYEDNVRTLKTEVNALASELREKSSSWWNKLFGR